MKCIACFCARVSWRCVKVKKMREGEGRVREDEGR